MELTIKIFAFFFTLGKFFEGGILKRRDASSLVVLIKSLVHCMLILYNVSSRFNAINCMLKPLRDCSQFEDLAGLYDLVGLQNLAP